MAHSVKCHTTRTGWTEPFSVAVTGNLMSDFCDHSSPQKPSLTWGWPWVTQLGCARGWANPLCSCQLWGRWNTDFINGKLCLKWHNWEYKSGIRGGDGKLMLWRRRSLSLFSFVLSCLFLSSRILVWGIPVLLLSHLFVVWGCTSRWEDVFLIVFLWSPLIWVN